MDFTSLPLIKTVVEYFKDQKIRKENKQQEALDRAFSAAENSARINSELANKRIKATEILWNNLVIVEENFSNIFFFDSILSDSEIDEIANKNRPAGDELSDFFDTHVRSLTDKIIIGMARVGNTDILSQRIYLSDKLWWIHQFIVCIQARYTILLLRALKENRSISGWRKDEPLKTFALQIISFNEWSSIVDQKIGAMHRLKQTITNKFVKEVHQTKNGTYIANEFEKEFASNIAKQKAAESLYNKY